MFDWLNQWHVLGLIVYLLIGFLVYCIDIFYSRASRFSLSHRYRFLFWECFWLCFVWPLYLAWRNKKND